MPQQTLSGATAGSELVITTGLAEIGPNIGFNSRLTMGGFLFYFIF